MWKGYFVVDFDIYELVIDYGVCYIFKNMGLDGFVIFLGNMFIKYIVIYS